MIRTLCAMILLVTAAPAAVPQRAVGIEGEVQVELGRGDYRARPLDDRAPFILRVGSVQPAENGRFVYQLNYIGFEPGIYQLRDWLVNPDGTAAAEPADGEVRVVSSLPAETNGTLNAVTERRVGFFGGYRMALVAIAVVWIAGLVKLAGIKRRRRVVPVAPMPEPGLAERLLPYIEAALAGNLTASGQAELERLFSAYWRERLGLPESQMPRALAALKRDPQAGALIAGLEKWLHRPGGIGVAEIERLLTPYRG